MTRRASLVLAAAAGALATALVGGIATAAIPGPSGVIQGCYDSGGNVKVVEALPCPRNYTPLQWNAGGPTGPPGDKGPSGDKGPTGDKGLTGDKGPSGDEGPIGDPGLKGAAGDKGPSGDPGDKGPTGDQGPTGDKGPTGDAGPPGGGSTLAASRQLAIDPNTWVALFDLTGVGRVEVNCFDGSGQGGARWRYTNTTSNERMLFYDKGDPSLTPGPFIIRRVPVGVSHIAAILGNSFFDRAQVFPGGSGAPESPSASLSIGGFPPADDALSCDFWGTATTH